MPRRVWLLGGFMASAFFAPFAGAQEAPPLPPPAETPAPVAPPPSTGTSTSTSTPTSTGTSTSTSTPATSTGTSTSTSTSTSTGTSTSTPATSPGMQGPSPIQAGAVQGPSISAAEQAALDKPAEHRSGVVFGLMLGLGVIDVSGYPNSASRLGDSAYHHSSGPIVGGGNRFFLMGALADTFNFGIWFGGIAGENEHTRVAASGGGFRLEAFPLYSVSQKLRNLGFVAQVGIGGAVADKKDKSLSVDGMQTFAGGGMLYELVRGRFIGLRPTVAIVAEYQLVTSPSIDSHGALVGARFAFYGGP